jgi:hypothetical protein
LFGHALEWDVQCPQKVLDLLRPFLLDMDSDEENEFELPEEMRNIQFIKRVQNYLAVLTFIEEATKALQQRGIPLAKAQGYLDILSKRIQKGRVEQKPWAKSCLLQTQYIGMERRKLVSKAFHHGVIKLQEDQAHDLTPEDKEALASLRIDKEENLEEVDISDTEVEETTIQEDYERKRKREIKIKSGVCMNPGFIVGSAAEIERVWSAGGLNINKKRCKSILMNFEALLFPKINKKHRDKRMVVKAIRLAKDIISDIVCFEEEEQQEMEYDFDSDYDS